MNKTSMLVIHPTFSIGGGAERFLLNFLRIMPEDEYSIDLLLFDNLQDSTKMFDAVPQHINILPFLWQFSRYSPELIQQLISNGQGEAARVREYIYNRSHDKEFNALPNGERLLANWELLRTICPNYDGYDYAVAFTHTLPVRILDCNVHARKKCLFIHNDFQLMCNECEDLRSSVFSEYQHYLNMDRIICGTEKSLLSFNEVFPCVSSKLMVLLNVSDEDHIRESSRAFVPEEYKNSYFNILTITRVHPQKDIELLLHTAYELKQRNILFKWFLLGNIGDSDYSRKCMELCQILKLDATVIFLGERENPFPYYSNCSLFVMTSRYEGRCIAIEEARILGCSIVSTNFSSIYDQITDGINGRICEMDSKNLASAIEELYHDSNLRNRLAAANSDYNGENEKTKYFQAFRQLN